MKNEIGKFEGKEQKELFYQCWLPDIDDIKAYIIAIHNITEHSDRFKLFAEYMTEKNYAVYAFDLRGHGKNRGDISGHIVSMEHIHADLLFFMEFVEKIAGEKKVFLLGHSFGGLLSLKFAINRPKLNGVIILSPLLEIQYKTAGVKKPSKKLIKDPLKRIPFEIDQKLLTSDLKIIKHFFTDKNRLKEITSKTYLDMEKMMEETISDASGLLCPVCILQAGNEKVGNKKVTKNFYEGVKSEDKFYKEYGLVLHDLLSEKLRNQVYQDIFLWLEKHK